MSIRSTAVDVYFRALRAPADLLVGRFAGDAAELTLDRADATARDLAGTLLGDESLRADAARRRAAADERERALRLRHQAERVEDAGEDRAQRQRVTARKQRAEKTEAAQSRARRERLDAVEEKAEALEHTQEALEAQDEAQRLGKAAAKVKQQRKSRSPNGARR